MNQSGVPTVHANTTPLFHRLLNRFKDLTGCLVPINTSFNVRGEPTIARTLEDALRCFMSNDIELLMIGNCVLRKEEQNPALKADYKLMSSS
jgi:carbamoyltransferase